MISGSNRKGQSLVEVVVVIGMVILLVGGLVVGTTTALRSSEHGRLRSQSVKYAQEGVEYARDLRNFSWEEFQAKTGVWCLDKDGALTESQSSICPVNIDNALTRSLTFAWSDPRMTVTVVVSWNDGSGDHASTLITYFTKWQ